MQEKIKTKKYIDENLNIESDSDSNDKTDSGIDKDK